MRIFFCKFVKKNIMSLFTPFKRTSYLISEIDEYISISESSISVFGQGVELYLNNNIEGLQSNLQLIHKMEGEADKKKREIANNLTKYSLIPEYRGDVLRLLERMDDIIDTSKGNLLQFEVEMPKIPSELNEDLMELTKASVNSVEQVNLAMRAFFKDVKTVDEYIQKVRLHEREADKLAIKIKRKVFHEMNSISLAEKFHIRYFTLHIENISDIAESLSDMIQIVAIKRTI